jgi:K+/H+ antiporter YhaU regulatory subunit KhtT
MNGLATCHAQKFYINPSPDHRLQKDDMLVVIGTTTDIDRLPI